MKFHVQSRAHIVSISCSFCVHRLVFILLSSRVHLAPSRVSLTPELYTRYTRSCILYTRIPKIFSCISRVRLVYTSCYSRVVLVYYRHQNLYTKYTRSWIHIHETLKYFRVYRHEPYLSIH